MRHQRASGPIRLKMQDKTAVTANRITKIMNGEGSLFAAFSIAPQKLSMNDFLVAVFSLAIKLNPPIFF